VTTSNGRFPMTSVGGKIPRPRQLSTYFHEAFIAQQTSRNISLLMIQV
jgi:hypothetical protein